ncbi:uncharacterized protein [Chelonus insularis]|uniref:uncharacterized protein n=1 Tax=Chelonus insularis TaxID=460826 RepID=UPI00158F0319|nr:uncharacterized protein LOC118072395 [Chelonus insularis]
MNNTFCKKSSNMESAEQYIKTARYRDTDQWSIYFVNKNGLSVEKIDKIVSEFVGKKKINQTSNPSGMCFINLFSFEDAVKCVKGLQGHELIQLKKQLKNQGELKKNGIKNDETNKSDSKYDEMYKSDFKHDEMFKSDLKKNEISKNGFKNDEIKQKEEESFIINDSDDIKKTPEKCNELITDLKAKKVIDTNTYDYLKQEFQDKKCVEAEPKMPELVLKNNVSNEAMSKDTTAESTHSVEENSDLIENVEAEELIIANIHEDYGTNYILHLLEKYQPIGASFVKVSERYALRYCHVYFTSSQYINEVQKKFDKFELGTKNLIVLYVNRLKGILSL